MAPGNPPFSTQADARRPGVDLCAPLNAVDIGHAEAEVGASLIEPLKWAASRLGILTRTAALQNPERFRGRRCAAARRGFWLLRTASSGAVVAGVPGEVAGGVSHTICRRCTCATVVVNGAAMSLSRTWEVAGSSPVMTSSGAWSAVRPTVGGLEPDALVGELTLEHGDLLPTGTPGHSG